MIGGLKTLFLDENVSGAIRLKAAVLYGYIDAHGKWPENFFPWNDRPVCSSAESQEWTEIDKRAAQLAKQDSVTESFEKSIAGISGGGSNANTSSSESK